MANSSDDRDPVERLADSFLARFRRGERPSIEDYVAQHPDLADEIRELLPALVALEQDMSIDAPSTGQVASGGPKTSSATPEQLGEYLILREIGRGGMGVVYEASQQSLGRHVALKVLPGAGLAGTHLERFRLESRAAARLHHTNIVPVFGVGEANGVHYYAMQFIQGQGLDVVIDELNRQRYATAERVREESKTALRAVTEGLIADQFADATTQRTETSGSAVGDPAPRAVNFSKSAASSPAHSELSSAKSEGHFYRAAARIGLQVAEALSYAHGQGILHRDIKPSNLILDIKGVIWVTDFGLAKSEGADGPTQTGDIVGTLRYMAPERFDGWSDPRTDVYALGATLYELLTLRPVYEESNRARLIEKVLHDAPSSPRKHDRKIPKDLETIVLKSLSREPSARYHTAEAMAEDLRRFLADKPILARRTGALEKTWRWCRRNPVVAGMAATLLVVFVTAFTAVTAALIQARADRKLANDRLIAARSSEAVAKTEMARADAGFAQARSAVDDYLNKVTEDDTLQQTRKLQPLRRKLLESAMTFYQGFLRDRRNDPSLRAEIAAVTLRMARVRSQLGDPTAKEIGREAIVLYGALVRESPTDPTLQAGWIDSLNYFDEDERAVEVGESALAANPDDPQITTALASAYRGLFLSYNAEMDRTGALEAARRSLELNTVVLRKSPDNPKVERELAANMSDLGNLASGGGRPIDSISLTRKQLTHARSLVARHPERLLYRQDLLVALSNVARREWEFGMRDQALASMSEGLTRSRELSAAHPDITSFAVWRFRFAGSLATRRKERGEPYDEADEEALAAFPTATTPNPGVNSYDLFTFAGVADRRIASLAKGRPSLPAAESSRIDAIGAQAVQAIAAAADLGLVNLAQIRNPLLWPNLRDRDDFRALTQRLEEGKRAVAAKVADPKIAQVQPTSPTPLELEIRARSERADTDFAIAVMLSDQGRGDEALRILDRVRGDYEALIRDDPKSPDHRFDLSRVLRVRADLASDKGQLPDAHAGWIAARDLQISVAADPTNDPTTAATCRIALLQLGETFHNHGLWNEANSALEAALAPAKSAYGADLLAGLERLMLGDEAGYRRVRDRALSRYQTNEVSRYAVDLAMLAALRPDPAVDRDAMIAMALRGLNTTEDTWAKVYLALAYVRAGRLDEAASQLVQYDVEQPAGVEWTDDLAALGYAVRAMIAHRRNRDDDARRALAASRRILDDLGIRFLELPAKDGFGFWAWAAARVLIGEASAEIEGRPERPEPWKLLMNAWGETQVGRPDRARAALARIAPEDAKTANVVAARAHILVALGDNDQAREDLEAAIRLDPLNVMARLTRGRLALAEGRPEAAAEDLVQALSRWPNSRDPYDVRGIIDRLLTADDSAFARAIVLRPDDPQLWITRGRYFAWRGRWKDAAEAYARGIGSRTPDIDWFEYGEVLVLGGDTEGYRRLCNRVAGTLDPTNPQRDWHKISIAARIARLSADSGIAPEVIVGWADTARKLEPSASWQDYVSGLVRLRARDQDEAAVRLLSSVNKQFPDSAAAGAVWRGLALVHGRLGHDTHARRWRERADSWLAAREREATTASIREPKIPLRDYLEAKILACEAR
jgi:serine/threonine protein kinase/tetratricopeptide (TPR) repeat protein